MLEDENGDGLQSIKLPKQNFKRRNGTMLLIVLPIFIVALLLGVDSWLWKGIFMAAVGCTWYFWGPLWITLAVVLTIGIAVKNSLYRITGSKI